MSFVWLTGSGAVKVVGEVCLLEGFGGGLVLGELRVNLREPETRP